MGPVFLVNVNCETRFAMLTIEWNPFQRTLAREIECVLEIMELTVRVSGHPSDLFCGEKCFESRSVESSCGRQGDERSCVLNAEVHAMRWAQAHSQMCGVRAL